MKYDRKSLLCLNNSIQKIMIFKRNAPVAQLDRVQDYESWGCTFDPCQARQPLSETLEVIGM